MKKITFLVCFVMASLTTIYSQGTLGVGGKQLNAGVGFSNWGTPVYVGMDFGVHESITIGPKFSYRSYGYSYPALGVSINQTLMVFSFNGNYHFNKLFNLPSKWDIYAGASLGYYLWSTPTYNGQTLASGVQGSGMGFDGQVGTRYFFTNKFGVNLEFGGGTGTGGNFGITLKL